MEDDILVKIENWFSYRFIPWFLMVSKYVGILAIFCLIAIGTDYFFGWDVRIVLGIEIILSFILPIKMRDNRAERQINEILKDEGKNVQIIVSDDGKINRDIFNRLYLKVRKSLYSEGFYNESEYEVDVENTIDKKIKDTIWKIYYRSQRKIKEKNKPRLSLEQLDKLQRIGIEAIKEAKEETKLKKKILLIDDDKFILKMYQIKLQKKGVEVETFSDTNGDIVQRVLDVGPDLITLDIIIPNRDGLETARMLKADERTKNIPIIFLTNQGQLKDIEDAKKVGCSAYIIMATTKPEEVVDYVISFLDKKC